MGIFSNIKKKVTDFAVQRQLKNLDPASRQMFEALMENNPELLEKISKEAQALTKSGKTEMQAMQEVGKKYQKELAEALQGVAGKVPAGVGTKGPF